MLPSVISYYKVLIYIVEAVMNISILQCDSHQCHSDKSFYCVLYALSFSFSLVTKILISVTEFQCP